MNTILKPALILCLVVLVFANCNKENVSTEANRTLASTPSTESLTSISESVGYILTGLTVSSKITLIRQKIKELGATEKGYISKLNLMFVSSDNTNFTATMTALGVTVVPDVKVKSPKSRFQEFTNADPNALPGSTNTFFPRLWGMQAISAPQAWALGYKGKGVIVAVLDEGFYMNHPDIGPNILQGVSRNFVTLPGENNPLDPSFKFAYGFSHSTHVAGTIAALDNNIGVIGVAPEAKIIAVKVLSEIVGYGEFSWIVQGIVYAADSGADVINMSLGALIPKGAAQDANEVQQQIFKILNAAIQYANSKGTTVICAAGNDAVDFDHTGSWENLPSNSPFSICISATSPESWFDKLNQGLPNNLDIPTSYTNFGSSRINFAAPGGDFDSPSPNRVRDMVLSSSGPINYYYAAGTSMAAPHTSGVAALIIGKNGGYMDPAKVKAKLKSSADDLGKVGKDPYFGDGRINAFRAVN